MRENLRYLLGLLGDFLSIGLAVGGSVFAGIITGWLIDEKLFHGKTSPYFTIICAAFGIAGGIKNIFVMTKRRLRNKKKDRSG
jgi:F0F1-type ATP synthase assembly protein I